MPIRRKAHSENAEAKFRQAVTQLLKPVARFAMRRGLKLQELIESLKGACLEVAAEELRLKREQVNTSRLSVLTGIQRKDIRRIKAEDIQPVGSPNLLNRIIGRWQSDPRFVGEDGKPRVLECEGAESEFSDLVGAVSVDTNPYTILFGLEQAEILERVGKSVRLSKPIYDASKNVLDGLQLLAQDSDRFHAAVSANLFEKLTPPHLHVTTLYDNICLEKLEEIRNWLLDRGSAFHAEVRAYLEKHDIDANPQLYKKCGGGTVSLCSFSFINTEESRERKEQ